MAGLKWFVPGIGAPTVVAGVVVLLLSFILLPRTFTYNYNVAVGHSYALSLDAGMGRQQARERAMQDGMKCAVLMVFGQHVPVTLLVLVTVGLVSKSTTSAFKRVLRVSYLAISLTGAFLLALGVSYWGVAVPFPYSIGPCLLIYLV